MKTRKTMSRSERRISKAVRQAAGQTGKPYPINVIDGFDAPELAGESYYFTNKSGDVIRYPNAYRRNYGKPIYNHSTLRIEVGAGWLIENGLV